MKQNEIKNKIIPILKKEGIKKAGLFGSYARGDQKKSSDIDILIQPQANTSLLTLVKIKILLEKSLKKQVDLVEYEMIKPQIKKQILSEEIKIL